MPESSIEEVNTETNVLRPTEEELRAQNRVDDIAHMKRPNWDMAIPDTNDV